MTYGLHFTHEFFQGPHDLEDFNYPVDKPTSVYQAIMSMPERDWEEMCKEVFNCGPDFVDPNMVLSKIEETDTCSNLDSPVEVWIDEDGYFTLDVFEAEE